eukprot:3113959-Prorocentrum_lima.AAC.1
MTSSLVGSEMCIRDRDQLCQVTLPARRQDQPDQATMSATAPPSVHVRSCLLYTSDAADDM